MAFFNDERKDKPILLSINKQSFWSKSDKEGYFLFDVKVTARLHQNQLIILKTDDNASRQEIKLFYPSAKEHVGIISDVDDTVMVSEVTHKIKLFYNTFFKNYKERELIVEIATAIKERILDNNLTGLTALFFISGSPHQFHNNINNFLDFHHFSPRILLTKKIHGKNYDDLQASIGYKYDKIVRLIQMYPEVKWLLFGDNGEKDAEIYRQVQKDYPHKIVDVYIRDVETMKVKKIRYNR